MRIHQIHLNDELNNQIVIFNNNIIFEIALTLRQQAVSYERNSKTDQRVFKQYIIITIKTNQL